MFGSSLKFYFKVFLLLFFNVSGKLVDFFPPEMYMQQGGQKDCELSNALFWIS